MQIAMILSHARCVWLLATIHASFAKKMAIGLPPRLWTCVKAGLVIPLLWQVGLAVLELAAYMANNDVGLVSPELAALEHLLWHYGLATLELAVYLDT